MARKVSEEIVSLFLNKRKGRNSNSMTDGKTIYLHGNPIARHTPEGVEISNAGWFSNVTKESLNALPGVSIVQKNWKWYLNGKEWNGEWVKVG